MIDLHIHSNCSDSSSTVSEILEEANRKSLSLLSITDHDVIDAYEQLKIDSIRNRFDGKIITGVEMTTTIDGELVEILGFGFDLEKFKENMKGKFKTFKEYKVEEFKLAVNSYYERGIKLDIGNIHFLPEYESCRIKLMKEVFSYPENIERLLYKSSTENMTNFSRNEFYNPKSPFYCDLSGLYISFQDAIDIVHDAGGLAFLAHPFVYSKNVVERLQSIVDRHNLDGIECFYYNFTKEQSDFLLDFCDRNNLYVSGGSDYHGTVRPGDDIGTGRGNLCVDEERCSLWTSKLKDFRG